MRIIIIFMMVFTSLLSSAQDKYTELSRRKARRILRKIDYVPFEHCFNKNVPHIDTDSILQYDHIIEYINNDSIVIGIVDDSLLHSEIKILDYLESLTSLSQYNWILVLFGEEYGECHLEPCYMTLVHKGYIMRK